MLNQRSSIRTQTTVQKHNIERNFNINL
jgi:hypothetical protein